MFPAEIRQVLIYKHESKLRSPHGGDLKVREGSSTGVTEVTSMTFLLSKLAYNYFY